MKTKKMADQQASHENTHVDNSSGTAQLARLLERLHMEPVDTLTARRELNILMPASRIRELKDLGYNIQSHRICLTDDHGRIHRGISLYYLSGQPAARVAT